MSRRATHWVERMYGVFVALYPRDFRLRYGPAMRLAFQDLLEDSEMPAWRIWLRVLRDLRGSFLHEHQANVTHRTGIVAGMARVAMLTVLIVTPVATGAVGYYLGRSQVAEPAFSTWDIFIQGQDKKWIPIWTRETRLQNSPVDVPALQRLVNDRTGETRPR